MNRPGACRANAQLRCGTRRNSSRRAYVWRTSGNGAFFVAAKGAPEAIGALCNLTEETRKHIAQEVARMAGYGLRVLGIAAGYIPAAAGSDTAWPAVQADLQLQLLGLAALHDPIRATAPAAVGECRGAGCAL